MTVSRLLMIAMLFSSLGCFGNLRELQSRRDRQRSQPIAEAPPRIRPLAIPAPVPDPQRLDVADETRTLLPVAQVPPVATQPIAQVKAEVPMSTGETPESIFKLSSERYRGMDAFESRFTRREIVNDVQLPMEVIAFKFRKTPFSVRMKWLGEVGHGRETIYVKGQHGDQLHILTAVGDVPLLKRPTRMSFSPKSSMVRGRSRRHIDEAGFSTALHVLERGLSRGPNAVRMLGPVQRREFPYPLIGVEVTVTSEEEPLLTKGGRGVLFFDMNRNSNSYGLPVITLTYDHENREVEYYCFDRLIYPVKFDDQDFHPDMLGK